MPGSIDHIEEDGYVATFTGLLDLDTIAAVRAEAAERFGDGTLRWAVMDLRDAHVAPAKNFDDEIDQVGKSHWVAREVKSVLTPEFHLALVADEARFGPLIDMMLSATDHLTAPRPNLELSIERFDELDTAINWSRTRARGKPRCGG